MKMPSEILLSVCIPTYNFGAFIGETLSSIVPQAGEQVEIVVLDGASTDDTEAVVQSFQETFVRLRYIRMPEKGGIDKDMALAVTHATGRYVWLFGADDVMLPGAVEVVLDKIRSDADVYLCETTLATYTMEPVRRHRNLVLDEERTFELSDPQDRREYLKLGANTQAVFSFCGALIIRRDRWEGSSPDPDFLRSCWAHVTRILKMIPGGLRIHHIPGSLSHKRMGNDSFMDKGIVARVRIAIDGYLGIAERFFPDAQDRREVVRCLRAEFTPQMMSFIKVERISAGDSRGVAEMNEMFTRLYAGSSLWERMLVVGYVKAPAACWWIASKALFLAKKVIDTNWTKSPTRG